jgi:hypothetical protein
LIHGKAMLKEEPGPVKIELVHIRQSIMY